MCLRSKKSERTILAFRGRKGHYTHGNGDARNKQTPLMAFTTAVAWCHQPPPFISGPTCPCQHKLVLSSAERRVNREQLLLLFFFLNPSSKISQAPTASLFFTGKKPKRRCFDVQLCFALDYILMFDNMHVTAGRFWLSFINDHGPHWHMLARLALNYN